MSDNINVGDLIIRPKELSLINHVGVYIGHGLVINNTPEKGEHICTIAEFADGKDYTIQRTNADPAVVRARVENIRSKPNKYAPLSNNCEHTAHFIIQGVKKSPQLVFWVVLAIVGLLIFCCTCKKVRA